MNILKAPGFEEIERAINLQNLAYETLLWLSNLSLARPHMLDQRVAEALRQTRTCMVWVEQHRGQIPERLRPAPGDEEAFARLFSSFFQTSFRIESRLHDAKVYFRIVTNKDEADGKSKLARRTVPKKLRLKRRDEADRLRIGSLILLGYDFDELEFDAQSDPVLNERSLRQDILQWSYACELVHRANAESHGPAAHILWKHMDRETRDHLSAYRVWKARERVISFVKNLQARKEYQ